MESEGHETQQGEASGLLTFADIQVKILKMLNEMPEVPLTVSWPVCSHLLQGFLSRKFNMFSFAL